MNRDIIPLVHVEDLEILEKILTQVAHKEEVDIEHIVYKYYGAFF